MEIPHKGVLNIEFTGRLVGVSRDWKTNQIHITFSLNEQGRLASVDDIKDAEKLAITVKKWRKKRSLNANNYAWQLMTELAHARGTSKEEIYELMLRDYGAYELDENGSVAIISVLEYIDCGKFGIHVEFAGKGHVGDKVFNHYRVIKGSSEYDTKEMSVFIDGIVSECKAEGIDTITPNELAQMKASWKGTEYESQCRQNL